MNLDERVNAFLSGREFSSGHRFQIGRARREGRNDLITRLARGRRVLHVGCADHAPLIEEKRKQGTYLHDALTQVAEHVVGLDTNEAALEDMRRLGLTGLYHPSYLPSDLAFDLIVAADVIEHVGDVDSFLRSLHVHDCEILVTTPNALRMANRLSWRSELVNTDHRYWFSPYTLSKAIREAGYEVTNVSYTDDFPRRQPLRSALKAKFPLCRDGLAVRARPAGR